MGRDTGRCWLYPRSIRLSMISIFTALHAAAAAGLLSVRLSYLTTVVAAASDVQHRYKNGLRSQSWWWKMTEGSRSREKVWRRWRVQVEVTAVPITEN